MRAPSHPNPIPQCALVRTLGRTSRCSSPLGREPIGSTGILFAGGREVIYYDGSTATFEYLAGEWRKMSELDVLL